MPGSVRGEPNCARARLVPKVLVGESTGTFYREEMHGADRAFAPDAFAADCLKRVLFSASSAAYGIAQLYQSTSIGHLTVRGRIAPRARPLGSSVDSRVVVLLGSARQGRWLERTDRMLSRQPDASSGLAAQVYVCRLGVKRCRSAPLCGLREHTTVLIIISILIASLAHHRGMKMTFLHIYVSARATSRRLSAQVARNRCVSQRYARLHRHRSRL